MRIADIAAAIESWAPPWIAWERDNVGLQVGDPAAPARRILLTLDVTDEVVREAVRRRVDLIVTHHPLLFRPAKAIVASDAVGRLVLYLARKRIALYAAHTNLDFTKGGVSFTLAHTLGLKEVRFLAPLTGLLAKIVVFVPAGHVSSVRTAMARAGAGIIGEYDECSFEVSGRGSFRASKLARPFIGTKGTLEFANEARLEMIAPRALVNTIVEAMKRVHPYDEVACDVVPVENESPQYGMGAVGTLEKTESISSFLTRVKLRLGAERVRYVAGRTKTIRTVAVCGGSGSDSLSDAIRARADAFVTADVRYHTFHDADGRIALIDAGHWETEHAVLPEVRKRLLNAAAAARQRVEVFIARRSTNPVHSN